MTNPTSKNNDIIKAISKQPETQSVIEALRKLKASTNKQSIKSEKDETEIVKKSDNYENGDSEDNKKSSYTKKVSGDGTISYVDEIDKELSEILVNTSSKEESKPTKSYNKDKNQNNQTTVIVENYDEDKDKNLESNDPRLLPKLENTNSKRSSR